MAPGFTVSVPPGHSPLPPLTPAALASRSPAPATRALSETVVLWPEASVPAAGDTVTRPIRPEDSVMDQFTGPNEALRVSEPPLAPSTIVVGVTFSSPRLGAELVVGEALLVLGAGELGLALGLDGRADGRLDG
jgi:hypothetical protein